MEAKIAAGASIDFAAISAGKFRRLQGEASPLQKLIIGMGLAGVNARDAARVAVGLRQAIVILRRYQPDVVFIKGGYVGLPVGLAARLLRIPYVVHESDTSLGLTNRILSRWAAEVGVGFPVEYYHSLPASLTLTYVGNPVRPEVLGQHRLAGLAAFGLSGDLPVVLVTGGSQGARSINDCLVDSLSELTKHCQILHITGELEIERIRFDVKRLGANLPRPERYQPHSFLGSQMGLAFAAADLVVSRAGANTIAELALLAKPTILIPNATMAGHQLATAKLMGRHGAARILDESRLTPERLVADITAILASEQEQSYLSKAIAQLARPSAASDLARLIVGAARRPAPNQEEHA